jgi:hypothetical protein
VAEWSKALAWKVSIRQKRIQGSNPCRSAKQKWKCSASFSMSQIEPAGQKSNLTPQTKPSFSNDFVYEWLSQSSGEQGCGKQRE